MKIERSFFPFAPSNKKLSSITILLHLVVYAALIWVVIKAQQKLREDFESPPAEPAINISSSAITIFLTILGVMALISGIYIFVMMVYFKE